MDKSYDLAVIGGGIAGAAVARDAALRGLKVILFEKNSFGSGTSSKSSKLIHGGLRYLETAWAALKRLDLREAWINLRFVFLSLNECRKLARVAPELILPISFVIPIYHDGPRRKASVYAGTYLYAILAKLTGNRQPWPQILYRNDLLRHLPALKSDKLIAAVRIWDHTTQDLALVQAVIHSAIKAGAVCHENETVEAYHFDEATKQYQVRTNRVQITAKKIINAAGPWVDEVRAFGGEKNGDWILPVAGAHIELEKFCSESVILQTTDRRIVFVINLPDRARVGTTEWLCDNLDHVAPRQEDRQYLLNLLHEYFPSVSFSDQKILAADAGVRPLLRKEGQKSYTQVSREHKIKVGSTGVLHLVGVKLTDHRRAAQEAVDKIIGDFKGRPGITLKSQTAYRRLLE